MKTETHVSLRGSVADEYYQILKEKGQGAADNFVRRIALIEDPRFSKADVDGVMVITRVLDS